MAVVAMLIILTANTFGFEFGDKHYSGISTSTQSTSTNTFCQKHVFFKTGTIINISFPFDLPAGGTYRFFVTNSLVTGAVYSGVDRTYTGTDLRSTTSLGAYSFNVTQNQVLYFCIDYSSGSFGLMERGIWESPTDYTSRYYGNDQSVNVGDDFGIWNGSSFPLTTRLTFINQSVIDPAIGGGYVYNDSTGNFFASAGVDRKVSTLDTGEEFYYSEENATLDRIRMVLKTGAGSNLGIKMAVKESGTDIINCTFNSSYLSPTYTFIGCNVSNGSLVQGHNYTVYAACYTNTSYTARCDGATTYIWLPTSRTPAGTAVDQHINWASWDTDRSHYTGTFYEDTPFILDLTETTVQCNDGVDNDGDGYTDYPADPSCTDTADDTESPYDYTQCNNGIDDDGDGYTDYPADPSCTSATDTSEYPKDSTSYGEDSCLAAEFCLLKDTLPYSDDLNLHDWYGTFNGTTTFSKFGNYKIKLTEEFSFYRNITNPNIYNKVKEFADIYTDVGSLGVLTDDTVYSYIWWSKDSVGRNVLGLKFDISRISPTSPDFVKIRLYRYDGAAWDYLDTYYMGSGVESKTRYELEFDQILKTVNIIYTTAGERITIGEYNWSNVMASKIYYTGFQDINYSSTRLQTYIDNIEIIGNDVTYDTVCDEWSLPYYLKESFNGYLKVCDWVTNLNIYANTKLHITNSTQFFTMDKPTDVAIDTKVRYVTMAFDLNLVGIDIIGSTLTFRLYNSLGTNFLTAYFRDTGDYLWYNDAGTGRVAGNVTLNTTIPYMFIVDMKDDNFNIYINGTKVVDGASFSQLFMDLKDIAHIKIQSNDAQFELDNLRIYGSDQNGVPLLPDDTVVIPVNPNVAYCGLFYRTVENCTTDDDCLTGLCLPNHRCSSFDYTYCDDNNKVRGNSCIVSAMANCVLKSTGNAILDNFWLFLVLLIIIMGFVYLSIMLRK